jgi:oligosaccharide 4-alpha-D-glucosyltransferase
MRGVRFKIAPGEQFYGGGQRVLGMDRRGHKMPLYNRAHYGYTTESKQMYYSLPAVMSDQSYAILFDNSATGELDIGADEADVLEFNAQAGRLSYIVVMADTLPEVVKRTVQTTGTQPLPPRWALGNFASRFGYRTQQETLDTAALFRQKDVPLDAIVLDLYWFGKDVKGHMGNLEWDLAAWPEPEQMIAQLLADNVKTIVITEPFILTTSTKWEDAVSNNALATGLNQTPKTFDFFFGNTGLVDVFSPDGQDWFGQFYASLAKQGVAGWWGDLGEPEVHPADTLHQVAGITRTADEIHNVYGHQWAANVYQQMRRLQPEQRPFILMRSGFLGSQRYGLTPWTGDVSRSWGGLQSQVELALQMSVFGLAYIHSDIGGFAGGDTFDPELYVRWTQHGVFSPVFRPHAQENIAPEPVFHDGIALDLARKYIKLRYRLMPYIYSQAMYNSMTGMPLMRPTSFVGAEFDHATSYMFGDAMLVTPVTEVGLRAQSVSLPQGVWFDYWQKTKLPGGQKVQAAAPLEQIPVHIKAGSFIPQLAVAPSHLDDYHTDELVIEYYADTSVPLAQNTWYEDDGRDPHSIKTNAYQSIHLSAAQRPSALSLHYTVQGSYAGAPAQRQVTSKIWGIERPNSVSLNSAAVAWQWQDGALLVTHTLLSDPQAPTQLDITW